MAKRQALHLVALAGAAQQDLRREGPVLANASFRQPGGVAVAAGGGDGRTHRHGAGRLLPPVVRARRQGPATARKIAVLFYNALRHGMDYADPGASYYEERYQQRVLANLQRRAKSLGYVLQQADTAPAAVGVS